MKKYWVNYSDKKGKWRFYRASVACVDLETATALKKVYDLWNDRNRITITDRPTGAVAMINHKPFTQELVSLILKNTLENMGFKVSVEIMEGRHDDLFTKEKSV